MTTKFASHIIRATAAAVLILISTCISAYADPSSAATATASVAGTVRDPSGAPIAGAAVVLRGPKRYTTTTDAQGGFSLPAVVSGVYVLVVSRPGFNVAVQNDVVAVDGQSQNFTVRMGRTTFSSLRTIATVHAVGRGTFNTSPASVSVVTSQVFADQGQPQVTRVLSQIPGVQISFPSTSANAATPGSITVPNIRDATSYETASMIDGHPISVGQYGDNVTTFLNSFMFSNVEVIKGPGANSPVVNNAIGGTTNFITKDPTLNPEGSVLASVDNRGGTYSNLDFSGTSGRLGYVFDLATYNNPSALNGKQVYYDPSFGTLNGGTLQGNATSSQVANTSSFVTNGYPLLACCYQLSGNLDQTAELLKFRYKLSSATHATVSYLDGQSASDQNGNTSDVIPSQFTPGPGYTGTLPAGPISVTNIFPGTASSENNNEPMFQAEIGTTLGKDTLLARYYTASILRYQFQGSNTNSLDYNIVNLFGTSSGTGNINQTFNGSQAGVGYNDFYQEPELDKLAGGTIEYQHPIGDGLVEFSVDRTASQSIDYSVFGGNFYSFNLPPGTTQLLTTYRLGGDFYVGPKVDLTLTNYFNTYRSTYPVSCPTGGCNTQAAAEFGTGVGFQTSRNTHDDPRIGIVYRPSSAAAIRLSAGSSIAPPFLGLLNQITSTPSYDATNGVATTQQSNGNLRPETAFGYDLGADVRLKDPYTVVSGDIYLTNLYNRFFGQTVDTGLVCSATVVCTGGAPNGTPILNQTNVNISNARFQGIELSIHRTPRVGLGYSISGSLQKGYYYDLPPYFYCSIPGPGCTQDQNLNIIAGENTNGDGIGVGGLSYNGNMRIPYSQGNAEVSYTLRNGAYASFGDTYYGFNNSLNEPAFGIAYATLRYPIGRRLTLQLSGDNIFNAYPGFLPVYGGGVPIPLIGNQTAATVGNVLGPATYRLIFTAKLP